MGTVYVAALIVGLGTVLLQIALSSGGADADAHVPGGDVHVDTGADAHSGPDLAGFFALFMSLRFWVFALLAFGLTGTISTWLGLASAPVTLVASLALGLGSGFLAAWVVHALRRSTVGSSASSDDVVGAVGRVLLPCGRDKVGKIRVQLRGQSLDMLAQTDNEELPVGTVVLVETMRDNRVVVSRAPDELSARKN